jgi:hypothetical protein
MSICKKLQLFISVFLIAAGLSAFAFDAVCVAKYGVDFNSAAFFLGNGEFVEWPTDGPPLYARAPLTAYGAAAWLIAILVFSASPEIRTHSGRVLKGTK